jgi:hypothetical protein
MSDHDISSAGFARAIDSSGEAAKRAEGPRSVGRGAKPPSEGEHVDVILQVAARDASIARVLREICGLDSATRSTALGLVAAHLRTRNAPQDVLDCIAMLRQDAVARRIAEVLTTSSSE